MDPARPHPTDPGGALLRAEPGWLPRLLKPVTEVRAGEAVTALVLTPNAFLLLAAYYLIKPVREALIVWERRRMQPAPSTPPRPSPIEAVG